MDLLESIHAVMGRIQQIEQRFASKRSAVVSGAQTAFAQVLTGAVGDEKQGQIMQMIEKYAAKHGVDSTLAKAVAKIESDNDATAISAAGAVGVMQLMPETARQLGVNNPLNPAENIEGGVRYLKGLLDKYSGNVTMALAAYNAGPGSVEKYGGIPPYRETQAYVTKVLDCYKQLS
jgi:soluble lytic murein transglycosylase-like protein